MFALRNKQKIRHVFRGILVLSHKFLFVNYIFMEGNLVLLYWIIDFFIQKKLVTRAYYTPMYGGVCAIWKAHAIPSNEKVA